MRYLELIHNFWCSVELYSTIMGVEDEDHWLDLKNSTEDISLIRIENFKQ